MTAENLALSSEINVYGGKVGIVLFGDKPQGVTIEARQVADTLRAICYMVWKVAKTI